jgi:hypothetical protein
MSESDYRKAVEETQKETSTSDTPDAATAPERRGEKEGDAEEGAAASGSDEVPSGT